MDPDSRRLSKTDRAFFNSARAVSKLSDHHYKLGCVVVDRHRIISSGFNSKTKCHRVQAVLDEEFFGRATRGSEHAEVAALLPLIRRRADLSSATVYVYREDRFGRLAMARPCPRCMSLLLRLGVRKIKYTTPLGFAAERIGPTEKIRKNVDF